MGKKSGFGVIWEEQCRAEGAEHSPSVGMGSVLLGAAHPGGDVSHVWFATKAAVQYFWPVLEHLKWCLTYVSH